MRQYNKILERKDIAKLRKELEKLFYDYHIRGCKVGDRVSNRICDKAKEETIKQIIILFKKLITKEVYKNGRFF